MFPLLRYGVIEFYGKEGFALSPSTSLRKKNVLLLSNCQFINSAIINNIINEFNLGLSVNDFTQSFKGELYEKEVPLSNFSLLHCLTKFNSLANTISCWEVDQQTPSANYQYFSKDSSWINTNRNTANGVYKKGKEPYSQRTVKIAERNWRLIPTKENVDSFNIAVSWSGIFNDWNLRASYNTQKEMLLIDGPYFPIILERLLSINTLLENKEHYNVFERRYFISNTDFRVLNRLFNYKLEQK